jgi:hypothetical protein
MSNAGPLHDPTFVVLSFIIHTKQRIMKNALKVLILSSLTFMHIKPVKAQVGFATEMGLNRCDMNFRVNGNLYNTDTKSGLALGGIVHCAMGNNFFVESGLFYLSNGCMVPGAGNIKINTIQMPLNIDYISSIAQDHGIHGFGGISPYIAYNMNGTGADGTALKIGSKKGDAYGKGGDDLKALYYGIGVNVGSILPMGLYVRVRYQISLTNLLPGGDDKNSIYSYSACVTMGYIFNYRSRVTEHSNSDKYWYNDHSTRVWSSHNHFNKNKSSGWGL